MMFQNPQQLQIKVDPKGAVPGPQSMDPISDDSKNFRMPMTFDGKRMRKAVLRKTVDYNAAIIKKIQVNSLISCQIGSASFIPFFS